MTMERSANDHSVVASGARLTKLAGGFAFTERPTSYATGNVSFTDRRQRKARRGDRCHESATSAASTRERHPQRRRCYADCARERCRHAASSHRSPCQNGLFHGHERR